jgi:hypothetical protein
VRDDHLRDVERGLRRLEAEGREVDVAGQQAELSRSNMYSYSTMSPICRPRRLRPSFSGIDSGSNTRPSGLMLCSVSTSVPSPGSDLAVAVDRLLRAQLGDRVDDVALAAVGVHARDAAVEHQDLADALVVVLLAR